MMATFRTGKWIPGIVFLCLLSACQILSGDGDEYTISVTFGKASAYSPHSNQAFDWSGRLEIKKGKLEELKKLNYSITRWDSGFGGCSREYEALLKGDSWQSGVIPGSGRALEGIRFKVKGHSNTQINIHTQAKSAAFTLGELLDEEYLEFHAGGKYAYHPIAVFLGPDARIRVSKAGYLNHLSLEQRAGGIGLPEDFTGYQVHFLNAWCNRIPPGQSSQGQVSFHQYDCLNTQTVPLRLQLTAADTDEATGKMNTMNDWVPFTVKVNGHVFEINHFFSRLRQAQLMKDIYVWVPASILQEKENLIEIHNHSETYDLLLHRVFLNEPRTSHRQALDQLPPLPDHSLVKVGYDNNTLVPQNQEIDSVLTWMFEEELGNYMLFRIEEAHTASADDYRRWARMAREFGTTIGTTHLGSQAYDIFDEILGEQFIGGHQHEASNLIYGWGSADPLPVRQNRTLVDCENRYMDRMSNIHMLGQALPMCHLDYRSGVDIVLSEFPTGHATLMCASNRGASKMYNKNFWGVHLANHVMRMPSDYSTLRRNFLFIWQSWLYGSKLIYDEESALYQLHSGSYAYSDSMTYYRRQQLQEFYHYAARIDLGKEIVETGYLAGKYDCLVGGLQSSPDQEASKFWGMFGPESPSWAFQNPERGWRLLETHMPGVWLYPVPQPNNQIRMFFSASPHGQTDLVGIDGPLNKLTPYSLLILPGWNTMTPQIYEKLIAYADQGGHLVLCAAQCTRHITRDFLDDMKNLNLYRQGDLSELAGVKVAPSEKQIQAITWQDGITCDAEGLRSLSVELTTGQVLAKDNAGNPVLVENQVGKGKVWMLAVGDYWGARELDTFRKQLSDRLTRQHRGDFYLTGDNEEVDYHVYSLGEEVYRVVLLNTDWTTSRNQKTVTLHTPELNIPVRVSEGTGIQILLSHHQAVISELPGSLLTVEEINEEQWKVDIGGAGTVNLSLVGFNQQGITLKMGPQWTNQQLPIQKQND